jgi:organic hydroperoxide reductase OsmC/OhrA
MVQWKRGDANFTDNRYSRGHVWKFDGGIEVPASSSPLVVKPPMSIEQAVDPEEALVAALSSCHMLFFLALAAKRGFVVDRYDDHASGTMGTVEGQRTAMTHVTLRPRITFAGERRPTPEEMQAIHHDAHEKCYIANSVRAEISIEPA